MTLKQKDNREIMSLYAKIANQSEEMLRAAQKGSWDELCAAEEVVSRLIHDLQTLKQVKESDLNERERIEHITYLKKILADDAEIRNITEPRLRQLEEFLRASSNTQKLSNSYGVN